MEISKIIYDYTSRNSILDIDAIDEICNLSAKKKQLDNDIIFITHGNSLRFDKYLLGEYDMDNTIYVFYNQIEKFLNSKIFRKKYLDDDNLTTTEITLIKNIHILETILHELEHAIQKKQIDNDKDTSLEKLIYTYEYHFEFPNVESFTPFNYFLTLLKITFISYRTYDISFMERMANINAKEQIIKLLKLYNNEFKKITKLEKKHLELFKLENYLSSYDGPTINFLKKIGAIEDFKNHYYYELINKMPLKDRYRLGFDITDKEFKKKIRQL